MLNEANLKDDIAGMVSGAIRALLPHGPATIGRVARELSLVPRTLQRRLRGSRLTFSQLLTATRVELAREGLNNGLTVTQLASVLRFSESSAVSRFLRDSGVAAGGSRGLRTIGTKGAGIEQVTDAVYNSEAPDRWTNAALTVSSFLEGVLFRAWVAQPKTNEVSFDLLAPGVPSFVPRVYDEHYFETDPRMRGALARIGNPVSCVDIVDPTEFDKSALVNDLLDRPGVDVRWCMLEAAPLHDGQMLFFVAGRPRKRGPFLSRETHRFDMAFGRLKGALEFEMRIDGLSKSKAALEYALDAASKAVFVVSKDLDVLHANQAAASLVGPGKGLSLAHGKLRAVRSTEQTAIERIVASAARGAAGPNVALIRSADGQRIQACAYRVPRSSFVVGGDRRLQFALVLEAVPRR